MRALLLVSLAAALAGCPGDDSCGPGDATGDGLVLATSGVEIRYHMMIASANNDCPDAGAPAGVVALTIAGVQVNSGDAITLCVPRPDLLAEPRALGTDILIVDVNATVGGCSIVRNTQMPASGTVHAEGLCENGADPAGFALVVTDGMVAVDRTCLATTDTLVLGMSGAISVIAP